MLDSNTLVFHIDYIPSQFLTVSVLTDMVCNIIVIRGVATLVFHPLYMELETHPAGTIYPALRITQIESLLMLRRERERSED